MRDEIPDWMKELAEPDYRERQRKRWLELLQGFANYPLTNAKVTDILRDTLRKADDGVLGEAWAHWKSEGRSDLMEEAVREMEHRKRRSPVAR